MDRTEGEKPLKREKPLYVSFTLPRCPACHSIKLSTKTTRKDAWGRIRYAKCKDCGRSVVITLD
jgi:transcription elongation factor Elf1